MRIPRYLCALGFLFCLSAFADAQTLNKFAALGLCLSAAPLWLKRKHLSSGDEDATVPLCFGEPPVSNQLVNTNLRNALQFGGIAHRYQVVLRHVFLFTVVKSHAIILTLVKGMFNVGGLLTWMRSDSAFTASRKYNQPRSTTHIRAHTLSGNIAIRSAGADTWRAQGLDTVYSITRFVLRIRCRVRVTTAVSQFSSCASKDINIRSVAAAAWVNSNHGALPPSEAQSGVGDVGLNLRTSTAAVGLTAYIAIQAVCAALMLALGRVADGKRGDTSSSVMGGGIKRSTAPSPRSSLTALWVRMKSYITSTLRRPTIVPRTSWFSRGLNTGGFTTRWSVAFLRPTAALCLLTFLLLASGSDANAQTTLNKFVVRCDASSSTVITAGSSSSTKHPISYPSSAVRAYLPNTTTDASIYSDSAGSTPLANPGTCNTSAQFVFYAAQSYLDIRLSPSGVTPFTVTWGTVYPIASNDSRIPTQGETDALAGTAGTPSSTNKFATNLDPRFRNIVNVKGYPYLATGDGSTDDTSAINAAITVALAGRLPLYFPVGRYLVSGSGSQIFLVNKNIEIFGDGESVSQIVVANSVGSVPILRLKPPTSSTYTVLTDQIGWHIHDFGIVSQGGESPNTSYSGGHNIVIDLTAASDAFMANSVFERLYLGPLGATASSTFGIYLSQASSSRVAGLQASSFRDIKAINGISLVNCNDNVILDTVEFTGEQGLVYTAVTDARGVQLRNVVDTSKRGSVITKGINVVISGCYFEIFRSGATGTSDGACLSLKAANAGELTNVQIVNTIFGTPSGPDLDGIYAEGVYSLSVRLSTFNVNTGKAGLNVGNGTNGTDWSALNRFIGASTTQYVNESNDTLFSVVPDGFPNSCTLSLKFGGASTGLTYTAQKCKYTRVGKEIHVWATLILSAKGSSTGSATLTGLPVSAVTTANDFQVVTVGFSNADTSFTTAPLAYIDPASPSSIVLQRFAAGAASNLDDTYFANNTVVLVNASYRVP